MELKALLKLEKKYLKRCERILTNAKVLYWKGNFNIKNIDLTSEENSELVNRIMLRHQISLLNKSINHFLVKHLKFADLDPSTYMKNYWNEIIEGFGNIRNKYTSPKSFQYTFLTNKSSPLYRRFADCLTSESMENYIIYLKFYLNNLKESGHANAMKETLECFADDNRMRACYAEPALPENWSDIYEQIKSLNSREHLLVENEENSL